MVGSLGLSTMVNNRGVFCTQSDSYFRFWAFFSKCLKKSNTRMKEQRPRSDWNAKCRLFAGYDILRQVLKYMI